MTNLHLINGYFKPFVKGGIQKHGEQGYKMNKYQESILEDMETMLMEGLKGLSLITK